VLARAEAEGVDLLVVGGGITGAGILLDAASRGMRALLVERDDFASGTSSRSSKMIHGGFRYLAEGAFRLTREACRERDRLLELNPLLVQPLDFLLPTYRENRRPEWQIRVGLLVYRALAGFRSPSRARMLAADAALARVPALRRGGLRSAGFYRDAQVDDARLVIESLKCARGLGAEAVNRSQMQSLLLGEEGRAVGAVIRDRAGSRDYRVRAEVVVNAAGPWAERVREAAHSAPRPMRTAKGVHVVVPRTRVPSEPAVVFDAEDGRPVFVAPWGDVAIIGTTDDWTREIDEPRVELAEVRYLLDAANRAFPDAKLELRDLVSVYAGVRPLAGGADGDASASSVKVSREDRIDEDASGLISVTGGKLTTYRAMGERVVDHVVRRLDPTRRARLSGSRSAAIPLREDASAAAEVTTQLARCFDLTRAQALHLMQAYGSAALELMVKADAREREPIGSSRFCYAEIRWAFERECAESLCDVLERRVRLALFAEGQGLLELERVSEVAQRAAGWSTERAAHECAQYRAIAAQRYRPRSSA
jgi:glycerol-3-phosphate dehydrogenase